MYYVYVLRSEKFDQYYFGSTADVKSRLKSHNAGKSKHTAKYKPWRVVWYGAFENELVAEKFEMYFKSASGKAFLRKRLL